MDDWFNYLRMADSLLPREVQQAYDIAHQWFALAERMSHIDNETWRSIHR